ncbi:MAG: TetR/AcrR family transcriptional regulator [Rhodospirillaceae bacterium]|nr:MAG: TetR/AcrR family transcriptional regulator [Rhodospirillaceae bacterium]
MPRVKSAPQAGKSLFQRDDLSELSHRDRKKARQRAELLRISLELFKEKGFDSTRMEDIALQADVSTPTVYNYFQTKLDVLVEILKQDREDTKQAFDEIVENPAAEPEEALATLVQANMNNVREPGDKRLWREILAAVARSHDKEDDSFEKNHEVFRRYIKRLLTHFIDAGKLSKAIPLDIAADIIFAINSHNLRYIASSERCTPERIRDISRQQFKLLMSNWRTDAKTASSKPRTARKSAKKSK